MSRTHTPPALRIRFVRFRQTVWRVVSMVTISREYNADVPQPSILLRGASPLGLPHTRARGGPTRPRSARVGPLARSFAAVVVVSKRLSLTRTLVRRCGCGFETIVTHSRARSPPALHHSRAVRSRVSYYSPLSHFRLATRKLTGAI